VAFFQVLRDQNNVDAEFGQPQKALLDTFNMMFGNFELDWFQNAVTSPPLALGLFVAFMIIVPTVMLNALIAIMVRAYTSLCELLKRQCAGGLKLSTYHRRERHCLNKRSTQIKRHF
jgi:hypothetical protein